MAFTASKAYTSFLTDALNNAAALALGADTLKLSLFDNTVTPDQTVASALTAYGAGVWASGGVFDASGWPAAGRPLASVTSTFSGGIYTLDAADVASANGTTTLGNTYGALLYDSTIASPVANQGFGFMYFGGAASVTSGTFTVVLNGSGVFQLSL